MSARKHLGKIGTAVAAIAVAALALSACAPGADSGDGTGDAGGGTLRVAAVGSGQAENLDPNTWLIVVDQVRIGALFDQLTTIGSDGQVVYGLAESMEPNEDATVWTVHLRPGVTFHDGSPLTADDVLYTVRRILESDGNASAILSAIDIDASSKVDDLTVEFVLNSPVGNFPGLVADQGANIVKDGWTDFSAPIGTGPFKYESFTPGDRSVFTRNDDYWGDVAKVERLEVITITDETAKLNALLAGQVDIAWMLPLAAASQVESAGLQLARKTGIAAVNFYVRADGEQTSDLRVRQALQLALDRQKCVDVALLGQGEVASDLFGPNFPSFPSDAKSFSYDPAAAAALLAEAGVPDLTIDLEVGPGEPGMMECAQVFQESAKAAGITINLVTVPADDVFNPDAGYLTRQFGMTSWSGNAFEAVARLSLLSNAMFNETGMNSPEFDAAFAEAEAIIDPDERNAAYAKLAKQVQEEAVYLIWGYQDLITGMAANVRGADFFANSPSVGFTMIGLNEVWLEQ